MAYWWVNHKQTYRQETDGGYIWSPKTNANGARNVSYDNLTRCEGGDVVFSYANGRISQIGLVETAAITAQKPPEFGSAGDNWIQDGWLVRVNWQPLQQPLVPQTFFELLQPLLPERHSPISTSSGRGNQGVYLAGLGLEVTSVDLSSIGLSKAQALAASRQLRIQTIQADLESYPIAPESLQIAVAIYAHLPSAIRRLVHSRIESALQPGGVFLLEAFHPNQLGRASGGPRDADLLYRVDDILADFPNLSILEAFEGQTQLSEGQGHVGLGYVTRVVLVKGALA